MSALCSPSPWRTKKKRAPAGSAGAAAVATLALTVVVTDAPVGVASFVDEAIRAGDGAGRVNR